MKDINNIRYRAFMEDVLGYRGDIRKWKKASMLDVSVCKRCSKCSFKINMFFSDMADSFVCFYC